MRFDRDRLRYAIDGARSRLGELPRRTVLIVAIGLPLVLVLSAVLIVLVASSGGSNELVAPAALKSADFMSDVQSVINENEKWAAVRIIAGDSNSGKERILIMGSVPHQGDLDSLRKRIQSAAPPVGVDWQVVVLPEHDGT
jgi:hypothetical protein